MLQNSPLVSSILLGLLGLTAVAGTQDAPHPAEGHPAARPADVASPEAIVAAMYDALSGPAGERDWPRFESLFIEEIGRLTPIAPGGTHAESWTPRDYQARFGTFYSRNATFTRELARKEERFAHLAHVFSTFAVLGAPGAEEPLQRGIHSFQLFDDGERWWILSVAWDVETQEQPLPARYLE